MRLASTRWRGMRHLALPVADVERSASFYEAAFGMRRFGPAKADGRVVPLVSPWLRDQISLLGPGAPPEQAGTGTGRSPTQGVDHFGFIVRPWWPMPSVRRHLERCGATFVGQADLHPSVRSMFFRDPDGHVFQVTRFPHLSRLVVALLPWARRRGARSRHRG